MNRKAFTLTELLICVVGLGIVAGVIGLVYVIAHFVSKIW
jgi:hypothetical protein